MMTMKNTIARFIYRTYMRIKGVVWGVIAVTDSEMGVAIGW
jgi:hypothetical protein